MRSRSERSVNPLFAREYALLLSTHRTGRFRLGLAPQRRRARARHGASLIASRLDALSPSEDLALKAASVIGDSSARSARACIRAIRRRGARSDPGQPDRPAADHPGGGGCRTTSPSSMR